MEKTALRRTLLQARQAMPYRANCDDALSSLLRQWLKKGGDIVIAAYWPIQGEFDPLPTLLDWQKENPVQRHLALPVVNKARKTLTFHAWQPGCSMEVAAFGIPEPRDSEMLNPQLLIVPCVGCAPGGWRLGYGGGFYDRTLASMQPRPATVGLCYATAWLPHFTPGPHDVPLDTVISDSGVLWPA